MAPVFLDGGAFFEEVVEVERDEEEADEGLEHRDEALDVVVVAVVILFLLLLLIFNLIWNIDRPLKVTTSEVFALKKLALP